MVLPVRANPTHGTVAQGTATFNTSGSTLTIQASDRAFINWQSFNIGPGETTTFVQPFSSSLVWNQINDPNPSQILGNLNANGYVVLQNQSGFYIGGQAAIRTGGLLMTTAPIPMPDLSGGGAWQFNSPPPTASIINYGQINIGNGGSAFLIANTIENQGTISAPQGSIGLYAGKQVLVSSRSDGRGLSARVTLPQGSVDNAGNLIADAGTIALNAQVVNQGGLIQANSIQTQNGVIELVASDSLNLGANSVISAKGDAQGISPGGMVIAKSGNTFSDTATSTINVSGGTAGGPGGLVEVFGSGVNLNNILSLMDGLPAAQFALQDFLSINPFDVTISAAATTASAPSPNFNISDLSGYSQVALFANDNIRLSTLWSPANAMNAATLALQAGNNITLDPGAGIKAGLGLGVNLNAGTALAQGSLPTTGNDSIILNGNSFLQSQDGDINLSAPNQVTVNSGAIRTLKDGSISVTTQYGDVNTGTGTAGFTYNLIPSPVAPFYYSVSSSLGGISTAAGGNVTITAGGNVTSYLPNASAGSIIAQADPGTGAFGSKPGNVTITAGGNIFGHYVVANGTGSLTAGQNLGSPSQNVALSLIKGSWNLDAPNGNIYLQEVRNPDGTFDQPGSINSPAYHFFDYDAKAAVDLTAGLGVYLTGTSLPRGIVQVPIIYPPSLDISAGLGGVNLDSSVILFPSQNQNLNITTSGGGGFTAASTATQLSMSDSSQTRFVNSAVFGTSDHAVTPPEYNNPSPVVIDISGNMQNINLVTSKETQITVGGDMIGCNFSGQNLHPGDVTSINVTGQIYDPGSFNSVFLQQAVPVLPSADVKPGIANNWEAILSVAVDPAKIAAVNVSGNVSPSQYYSLYVAPALAFGSTLSSFFYNQTTGRLTYSGTMDPTVAAKLEQPLTVVRYGPDGNPLVVNGKIQTDTLAWVPAAAIQTLLTASQGAPGPYAITGGYQIGGPGEFDITAGSLSLGNSLGILSYGSGNQYANLAPYLQSGGASIKVMLDGDLEMPGSTIAALGGGNVKVESTAGSMDLGSQDLLDVENLIVQAHGLALGIYSTGGGNVDVTALGDIKVDSSRIATFNGGHVNVESFQGNVDAGSGGTTSIPVYVYYVDAAGKPGSYLEQVYANGIVAETLVRSSQVPGGAVIPGDIMVTTPQGDIDASLGGILQESLNGVISAGPTVTLSAGSAGPPAFIGNVNLGDSGVIGGTVDVAATGNISGLVISRQSSSVVAQQNFTGTVLSGGSANVSAVAGSVTGTVIGVGGANVTGGTGVTALVLGQSVSVNGGAATSTLGTSSTASTASQSAAGTANADSQQQVSADTTTTSDDLKKKKLPLLARLISRVTVILPK